MVTIEILILKREKREKLNVLTLYVCMYVCMYVYVCVCVYVRVRKERERCVCVCVCMYLRKPPLENREGM